MARNRGQQPNVLDRSEAITSDPNTVRRIKALAQQTGYHPTYIAAWFDVENANSPEERANRAAMMSRGKGDAFAQYADNSQRQWETKQQMKNSRKNRKHQTSEREAGQEFTREENQTERDFRHNERMESQEYQSNEAALRRDHENADREAKIKAEKKQSKKNHKKTVKENKRQEEEARKAKSLEHDRRMEGYNLNHDYRMEEINAQGGNQTNAEIAAREHDAVLAEPPSFRRYNQLVIDARSMLGEQATPEEIQNFLQQDMQATYFDFFHNPESPIAASGHVPPGLSAEMKEVMGEMSFEEFADYVGLDENDGRTGQWYTEITGKAPNHDHWLW